MRFDLEVIPLSTHQTAEMVAFIPSAQKIFLENKDKNGIPVPGYPNRKFMPWGVDNQMPYEVMELIDSDETMSQCMRFRTELCYAQGLRYHVSDLVMKAAKKNAYSKEGKLVEAIQTFLDYTQMPEYFLGVSSDMMYFDFAVTTITLSRDRKSIASIGRKEAMHCRFEVSAVGYPKRLYYANWRDSLPAREDIECIPILDSRRPLVDLRERISRESNQSTFAIVTRYPSPNPSYYPIPSYASLFKSKWYDIKRLIAIAKYSKLKNSAPLKFLVEVERDYWDRYLDQKGITDEKEQQVAIREYKQQIIDFLSGAENSGKSLFSGFYVDPTGKEVHDIKITNLETSKPGGDWESDIQESANIICFAMGVHPNVVGAVPGKSQSNNSGSDKRELFTMEQARMTPYRDLLFAPHRVICRFNDWADVTPEVPLIQLTTLDEHKDAKEVTTSMEE